jgi:hypothetical protein
LQFPESLCTQLLRAKYYPWGNLTDTTFPMEALPTWRAIEHGLELVKRGLFGVWDQAPVSKYGAILGFLDRHHGK